MQNQRRVSLKLTPVRHERYTLAACAARIDRKEFKMKAVPAFRLAYKLPLLVIGLVLTITAILITISSLALQRAAMDSV